MAQEVPGFCKRCGALLVHAERSPGRSREFCGATCRQAFNRDVRLRRDLAREVGLSGEQIERLLAWFRVSARPGLAMGSVTPRRHDLPDDAALLIDVEERGR
jgi:hypothetical protein